MSRKLEKLLDTVPPNSEVGQVSGEGVSEDAVYDRQTAVLTDFTGSLAPLWAQSGFRQTSATSMTHGFPPS